MTNNVAVTLQNFTRKFWKLTELVIVKFLVSGDLTKNDKFCRWPKETFEGHFHFS